MSTLASSTAAGVPDVGSTAGLDDGSNVSRNAWQTKETVEEFNMVCSTHGQSSRVGGTDGLISNISLYYAYVAATLVVEALIVHPHCKANGNHISHDKHQLHHGRMDCENTRSTW